MAYLDANRVKVAAASAAVVLLAGCAWMPEAKGFPEKVVRSDPNMITIEWNRWQVSDAAIRARAVNHCNGRQAVEVEGERERQGMLRRVRSWRCVGV